MKRVIKEFIYAIILLVLLGGFSVVKANAASLSNASDTLTTSRPSSATFLTADQVANDQTVQVADIPGPTTTAEFLASDSAMLLGDVGQGQSSAIVSSMSAQQAGTPTFRYLYFGGAINPNTAHHKGSAVISAVTATHSIKFTTVSQIPSGGKIKITFPTTSGSYNTASPSATTFSFNGELASPTDIVCYPVTACSTSKSYDLANNLTFTTGAAINAGTTIYINIGCSSAPVGPCATSLPRLINPTKSNITPGSADTWKVYLYTTDSASNVIDSGSVRIATIESVQVQAIVEPTITFSIIGGWTNTNNASQVGTGCDTSLVQNTGIATTATFVNMGILIPTTGTSGIQIALQQLQVTTNGASGYVITATSSGRFINPANGQWLPDANGGNGLIGNDNPAPATITGGTPDFGIHACGPRSNLNGDEWVNAGALATAKFANPWNTGSATYSATLASYTGGAVSTENTAVVYGATISSSTPPGLYSNYFTYVATATF